MLPPAMLKRKSGLPIWLSIGVDCPVDVDSGTVTTVGEVTRSTVALWNAADTGRGGLLNVSKAVRFVHGNV